MDRFEEISRIQEVTGLSVLKCVGILKELRLVDTPDTKPGVLEFTLRGRPVTWMDYQSIKTIDLKNMQQAIAEELATRGV